MQFKELVQSDEFKEYRRREIEVGADFVKRIWTCGNPEFVRGTVEMLSKIIRLPLDFSDAKDTKEFMSTIVQRDFAEFEAKFLRKHLVEE